MMEEAFSNIRIVLVEPTHPGNIGAAARAMKTMGLRRLYLVNPVRFPSADATAMASGADDLLVNACVCRDLAEALSGCGRVIGTTARERRIPWPVMDPRTAATEIVERASNSVEVAVLFGREHSGLNNDEVESCQAMVRVPTDEAFSSLNLAAAVQLVAYEVRMAALLAGGARLGVTASTEVPATQDEMERMYAHLEDTLAKVGFLDPEKPRRLMRRLRRLYNRALLDQSEVNILRGFFTAIQGRLRGP